MAYLTRIQMYRALMKNWSGTSKTMIFTYEGDPPEPPDTELDWIAANGGIYASDLAIYAANQRLGPNNTDAGLNDDTANIRSPQTDERAEWYDLILAGHDLLERLVTSGHDDFGSYGNPAYFTTDEEELADAAAQDYWKVHEDRKILEDEVKAELQFFRSKYTDGKSQEWKETYYTIAYAEDSVETEWIAPINAFVQLGSSFLDLERSVTRHQPYYFTFHTNDSPSYSNAKEYCAVRIVIRVFALHNALYGSNLRPLAGGWPLGEDLLLDAVKTTRSRFLAMLTNISTAIDVLLEDIEEWKAGLGDRRAAAEDWVTALEEARLEDTGISVHELTDSEIYRISRNPEYNEYFTTTFSQDIITTVPIIHNLYLTEQYFEEISGVMVAPKIRALDTLITIITEDGDFDMSPNMDRPASRQAIAAANGDTDFGPFLQELLIKILIETPINILKSLCELIDPHVAITKMIRMGSMHAFAQGAKAIDASPVPKEISDQISEAFPDIDIKVTGEDLMGILVCLIEVGFTGANMGLNHLIAEDEQDSMINFFPTATYKGGIDFTGTVSGMIMAPPLPLGLLYLLLELIKSKLNQTENLDTPLDIDPGCEDEEGEDDS